MSEVKAGTHVYCQRGHRMGWTLRTLKWGGDVGTWGDAFEWFNVQKRPCIGGPAPICCCGAPVKWPTPPEMDEPEAVLA